MVYGQQHAEIWRSHDVIWQDTDIGASTSLDHHCAAGKVTVGLLAESNGSHR